MTEVLNIKKIVKIYDMDRNQTRINMDDGSYTVTDDYDAEDLNDAIIGGVQND